MRATHLQVEYLTEPLGLGNPKPRFYWNCEGGIRQTAYQIICKRGNEIVWDSGKVTSSSMTHIRYAGQPCAAGMLSPGASGSGTKTASRVR